MSEVVDSANTSNTNYWSKKNRGVPYGKGNNGLVEKPDPSKRKVIYKIRSVYKIISPAPYAFKLYLNLN